jgi:hypothetical protein
VASNACFIAFSFLAAPVRNATKEDETERSSAWIGTNQVRAKEEERGSLIKPGEIGSGYSKENPGRPAAGQAGILGVAKYPVKNKESNQYSLIDVINVNISSRLDCQWSIEKLS